MNKLEAIKEKVEILITGDSRQQRGGSTSKGVEKNHAPINSILESVVPSDIALDQSGGISNLTNEALSELKKKEVQAKVGASHFADFLLNKSSTKDLRVGRSLKRLCRNQHWLKI